MMYHLLDETTNINVDEDFVSFCAHFKYLGTWVLFSLCDNHDIGKRLAAENAAMGALNYFWYNEHVDTYLKYLMFRAIPGNLLLWGCESWKIRDTLPDVLNVFLYLSIRKILLWKQIST